MSTRQDAAQAMLGDWQRRVRSQVQATPEEHVGALLAAAVVPLLAPVRAFADQLVEQGDEHVTGCVGQADCAACVHHDLICLLDAIVASSKE